MSLPAKPANNNNGLLTHTPEQRGVVAYICHRKLFKIGSAVNT